MSLHTAVEKVTPREFASLPVKEQLDVLRCVDARQKSRYLLAVDNGDQLLAALPEQSVYLMFKELGIDQLTDLLAMASGDQWTAFVDLDCWTGEHFNPAKLRLWLTALLGTDEDHVIRVLKNINFETLVLLLKHEVMILAGPDSIADDDARIEAMKRDGGYQLDFHDEDGAKLFGGLLDVLLRLDTDYYRYLLETVRAEMLSLIEESVFQQRGLRLLDMGLPEPWSARDIYALLDPEIFYEIKPRKIRLGLADQGVAPGFPLALTLPEGLLAALLQEGIDDEIAWELTGVVNKVALADNIDLGELEAMRHCIQKVHNVLNLALEWLVGSDVAAGREKLADCYLQDLFRLGHSLVMQLQRRAARIAASSIGPYLDARYHACVNALQQQPPQFFMGLENSRLTGQKLFSCARELTAATEELDRLEVQRRLFEEEFPFALPGPADHGPEVSAEEVTLVDFFLTALANRLMGRHFTPQPFPVGELVDLHGLVTEHGDVNPGLRAETCQWLEQLSPGGGVFGGYCLDVWAEEFCAIRPDALDPRFLKGLIVHVAEAPKA